MRLRSICPTARFAVLLSLCLVLSPAAVVEADTCTCQTDCGWYSLTPSTPTGWETTKQACVRSSAQCGSSVVQGPLARPEYEDPTVGGTGECDLYRLCNNGLDAENECIAQRTTTFTGSTCDQSMRIVVWTPTFESSVTGFRLPCCKEDVALGDSTVVRQRATYSLAINGVVQTRTVQLNGIVTTQIRYADCHESCSVSAGLVADAVAPCVMAVPCTQQSMPVSTEIVFHQKVKAGELTFREASYPLARLASESLTCTTN